MSHVDKKQLGYVAPCNVVDHPKHYNAHPSGVECIDVVEHMSFNLGNAVKYLYRSPYKHSDPVLDLQKSLWYIKREITRRLKNGTLEDLSLGSEILGVKYGEGDERRNTACSEAGDVKERIHDPDIPPHKRPTTYLQNQQGEVPIRSQDGVRDLGGSMPRESGVVSSERDSTGQSDFKSKVRIKESESPKNDPTQNGLQRDTKSSGEVGMGLSRHHTSVGKVRGSVSYDVGGIPCDCRTNKEKRELESKIQAVVDAMPSSLLSNSIRYLFLSDLCGRCTDKIGSIEDLQKAAWYLARELQRLS
ncbi:MAG: hypothetical protein UY48_C0003G0024 [Candidatus Gottesmanbacteria bacterium GW2011_GWB1_49_7]|uniref:DUF3310 domain-containing protein n=1 Tax=Candidatus Gottesmanbacteria bacterium GW2011_GWB1_49_7 TaxID=1618448 RepID=A0A0G1YE24_9BACT|nr:MAG: hypothetical protein UY48_C0003G0024 [Candidatus Gottesmanbacteria bacterium GW2011_GWB1_49_7]